MKKLQEFIVDAMQSNPKAKFYWDDSECHFMMETHHGQHISFGKKLSFQIQWDASTKGVYYVDENNCRIYLLYVVYAD